MRNLARVTAVLLLLTGSLWARERAAKVRVKAACFPGGGSELELDLYLGEDGESMPVVFWPGKLAPEVEIPRLPVWRFGRWETREDPDRKGATMKVFVERGRAKPAAAGRQWILALRQGGNPDEPLRIRTYGADDTAVREGGALFLNLTRGPIRVDLDGQRAGVGPGRHRIINPNTGRGQQYPIVLYYQVDDGFRPFVESTWFHGERRRRLAIIMHHPEARAPRLFCLTDIAPRREER